MSGKTTQIKLVSPDNPFRDVNWITTSPTGVATPPDDDLQGVRKTVVYAQAEETRPAGTVARTFVTSFDADRIFRSLLGGAFDRWEEWF